MAKDAWTKLNIATRRAAKNPTEENLKAARDARREYKEEQAKENS